MRSTAELRIDLATLMPVLQAQFGVRALSIFGSYARGEQTPESDLDLLVEFEQTPGLLRFVELSHLLEDQLGVRVDLATPPMIGPHIAPQVTCGLIGV